jgi:hypothetical protein
VNSELVMKLIISITEVTEAIGKGQYQ